ncbi:tetratricopeptide repeat protein [Bacillus sp. 005/A4HT-01/001]|uniref:tetratricopeptide repeat protein n=1 Tax=Bacillus sp. 005/A4HT-01/001 TaxID=2509010 RepID=UPI001431B121|nr:tetratricopeptide repeat protein [Bacillus sp. 005/A4HT-01/001]
MVKTIAYEEVANMMNEWYGLIKKRKVDESIQLKEQIKRMLPHMEQNQDLLLYFNLLDFRNNLLIDDAQRLRIKSRTSIKQEDIQKTDDMIQYYFYFFNGQFEFHNKNYIDAINFYKIAEDKLKKIPDEIEHAEFHYKIAEAYYRIFQNFFSMSHAEKALNSFKSNEQYTYRQMNSELLLALNKVDLLRYKEADQHYENIIKKAQETGDFYTKSLAHHNIGISYEKRGYLPQAESHLLKAIDIPEHRESRNTIRTYYMLSKVCFKSGKTDKALVWYKKAWNLAEENNEDEYRAKLMIIDALYNNSHINNIHHAMKYLEKKHLWIDIAELSREIGNHLKNKGNITQAVKYYEHALTAKDELIKMTEALE